MTVGPDPVLMVNVERVSFDASTISRMLDSWLETKARLASLLVGGVFLLELPPPQLKQKKTAATVINSAVRLTLAPEMIVGPKLGL
jgi:hypothetical protein